MSRREEDKDLGLESLFEDKWFWFFAVPVLAALSLSVSFLSEEWSNRIVPLFLAIIGFWVWDFRTRQTNRQIELTIQALEETKESNRLSNYFNHRKQVIEHIMDQVELEKRDGRRLSIKENFNAHPLYNELFPETISGESYIIDTKFLAYYQRLIDCYVEQVQNPVSLEEFEQMLFDYDTFAESFGVEIENYLLRPVTTIEDVSELVTLIFMKSISIHLLIERVVSIDTTTTMVSNSVLVQAMISDGNKKKIENLYVEYWRDKGQIT